MSSKRTLTYYPNGAIVKRRRNSSPDPMNPDRPNHKLAARLARVINERDPHAKKTTRLMRKRDPERGSLAIVLRGRTPSIARAASSEWLARERQNLIDRFHRKDEFKGIDGNVNYPYFYQLRALEEPDMKLRPVLIPTHQELKHRKVLDREHVQPPHPLRYDMLDLEWAVEAWDLNESGAAEASEADAARDLAPVMANQDIIDQEMIDAVEDEILDFQGLQSSKR